MKEKNSFRKADSADKRRRYISSLYGFELRSIDKGVVNDEMVEGRHIENFVGTTQVPLGLAGPMKIDCLDEPCFVPMATSEGALVASTSRGAKATLLSGGIRTEMESVGVTRGPVFVTESLGHGKKVEVWVKRNFNLIASVAKKDSSHIKLLKIDSLGVGRNLFLRMHFDSSEAMGMNMATQASQNASDLIEKKTGAKLLALAGNFDIDKKSAWLNFIQGRGKKVWAEVLVKRAIVKKVLKTTPEKIAHLVMKKNYLGSALSGSMGFNAHFANIVSAVFIATGQDPAHVVEGSMGVVNAEVVDKGDLYFAVYLPSLMVGVVGGGTALPTQAEAIRIVGQGKKITSEKFARVIGGAVLCGELSLLSSISEGSLVSAHQKLGRAGKRK